MNKLPSYLTDILKKHNINADSFMADEFIGYGEESFVFKYKKDLILKIYKPTRELDYIKPLSRFYEDLNKYSDKSIQFPEIYEINKLDKLIYTIEKRFKGFAFDEILYKSVKKEQKIFIQKYVQFIDKLKNIIFQNYPFGDILKQRNSINSDSWQDYLLKKIESKKYLTSRFIKNNLDIEKIFPKLRFQIEDIINNNYPKSLIHGDLIPANVMLDESKEFIAIIDFCFLVCIGDHNFDLASASIWPELDRRFNKYMLEILNEEINKNKTKEEIEIMSLYKVLIALFSADLYDEGHFSWAVDKLISFQIQ